MRFVLFPHFTIPLNPPFDSDILNSKACSVIKGGRGREVLLIKQSNTCDYFFEKKPRNNKKAFLSDNAAFNAFSDLDTCFRAESYFNDMISQI